MVVLQGNIILQAGWQEDCHEVWAVIISEKEVILYWSYRFNLGLDFLALVLLL